MSLDPRQLRALLVNAAADARIRYVEPMSAPRELQRLRNDPMLRTINPTIGAPYEWEFATSRVDSALNLTPGSPTVVVGVIDSGVADIPDLSGKIASRSYFTGPVDSGDDLVGHGTAVASIVAANDDDGFGMAGFGGATRVISFRDDLLSDESIAMTTKLVSLGVRIINISAGGRRVSSPLLQDAIQKAIASGVLIVGSAGNDGLDVVSYPASNLQPPGGGLSYGLAVGATNFDGTRAAFSNQGTHLSLVRRATTRAAATACSWRSRRSRTTGTARCYPTFPGDGGARYTYAAGTSFSAPEVSGAAALVWAAAPLLKNFEVAEILKRTAATAVRLDSVRRLGLARRRGRARGRDRKVERGRAQHQELRLRPGRRTERARDGARQCRVGRCGSTRHSDDRLVRRVGQRLGAPCRGAVARGRSARVQLGGDTRPRRADRDRHGRRSPTCRPASSQRCLHVAARRPDPAGRAALAATAPGAGPSACRSPGATRRARWPRRSR